MQVDPVYRQLTETGKDCMLRSTVKNGSYDRADHRSIGLTHASRLMNNASDVIWVRWKLVPNGDR